MAAPCARAALQGGEAHADAVKSQESREEGCSQGGRQQAGHQQAPLVVRGCPWWICQAWGLGAWGRFWQALSASSLRRDGAGSTASMLHSSHALILPQEFHLFRGPPAHQSTLAPSARPGGCAGPTLALPDCQAGQARQCGSAQGKGWSTPYHRPRWEPVLMPSRAPAAPQRQGGRREAAVGAGPPPHPSPGQHGGSDCPCPPMSTCPRSEASQ